MRKRDKRWESERSTTRAGVASVGSWQQLAYRRANQRESKEEVFEREWAQRESLKRLLAEENL